MIRLASRIQLLARPEKHGLWKQLSIGASKRSFTSRGSEPPVSEPVQASETANDISEPDIDIPWYLREDITSSLVEQKEITLPDVPSYAPELVSELLNLSAHDYGMDNIMLFDMTKLDSTHEFRANNSNVDFIIIGTGKSEKHIYKAGNQLRIHLKHTYGELPLIEGLVSSAKTPAMRRRLLRRARKGPAATDNEYGRAANSWVLCNLHNVDVHFMTEERRDDLNMESVWCAPEDKEKFEKTERTIIDDDNIFSGIRRYHTSARLYSPIRNSQLPRVSSRSMASTTEDLQTHLHNLRNLPVDAPLSLTKQHKAAFDQSFHNPSSDDHETRYQFLKLLHVTNPEVVLFSEVEEALLAKYASPMSLTTDMAKQKIDDVTEYAKLLLDSAEFSPDVEGVDSRIDKLSNFISVLYTFSEDKFSMSSNAHFIPLLWRLTYQQNKEPVTPHMVDLAVHNQEFPDLLPDAHPSITLGNNNARDVLYLLEYHNQTVEPGYEPTAALRELILFTYGNAGKWTQFWAEWEKIHFLRESNPSVAVEKWVRLAIFLTLSNNKEQVLHFLTHLWNGESSVSFSFLKNFADNGEQFNSKSERLAFKKAVLKMVQMFSSGDKVLFDGVTKALERM